MIGVPSHFYFILFLLFFLRVCCYVNDRVMSENGGVKIWRMRRNIKLGCFQLTAR